MMGRALNAAEKERLGRILPAPFNLLNPKLSDSFLDITIYPLKLLVFPKNIEKTNWVIAAPGKSKCFQDMNCNTKP